MKVSHFTEVKAVPVEMEGAVGCKIRVLVGEADGAPHFAMRQFEVAPAGHTPHHAHDSEHEVYVLEGDGAVWLEGEEHPLRPGSFTYVPAHELHHFANKGEAPFKFLCLVPITAPKPRAPIRCNCTPDCGCNG